MRKEPKIIDIKVEKLVFGGQGLAHADEKTIFAWNVLPGEEAQLEITSKRKGIIEGVALEITKTSNERIEPMEPHFLSCSPWQILSEEAEHRWKIDIAKETFKKLGGFDVPEIKLVGGQSKYGYRNKMEYSFFEDEAGEVHLALFARGSHRPTPIQPCQLANDELNNTAVKILTWIRKNKISRYNLKSLIIRSNLKGETIAALFAKDESLNYSALPTLDANFLGFDLYYSTHKSPASVITKVMAKIGQDFIEEDLLGTKLRYGVMSFFQINVPVFEKTLSKISEFISKGDKVVDFYSGVGAISIPLHNKISNSIIVDSNEEAIEFAKKNIELNSLNNYQAHASPAEKILGQITGDRIIIFDPPRVGLHGDVVKRVLEVLPEKIIYLSCNISTQARDIKLLSEAYRIEYTELYDYFPRTPHFESLIILKRIK